MQSVLILGTKEETRGKALALCKENKISKFDIEIIETEKAVGIGDVRTLQKKIFLKPIQSEKKAVILESFFGMTIESQNAFLKVLEEPPLDTIIILLATSLDFLLPTVLSRCVLVNLEKTRKLTSEEISENLKILSSVKNVSDALVIAQNYSKSREEALDFLEGLIISTHENLEKNKNSGKVLEKVQKTYTTIKNTNVNVRFALENLFLNI